MATGKSAKTAPWNRTNPKAKTGGRSRKMTAAQKSQARSRAKKAGRPYPNLVDNMAAAKTTNTKSTKTKSVTKPKTRKAR